MHLDTPALTIGDYQRGYLRAAFHAALAQGTAQPLLFPWVIVPPVLLPALYLTIPQHPSKSQGPSARAIAAAARAARIPLVVAITAYCADLLLGLRGRQTGSLILSSAFCVGMAATWGWLWMLTVLVWMDPQRDAERVERRRRPQGVPPPDDQTVAAAPDADIACSLQEGYEYYWQSFPADAPFLTRLDWTLDLCTSWRGTGWNWSTVPVPHFRRPALPHSGELVQLSSLPLVTAAGFRRKTTHASFVASRLAAVVLSYVALDICAVLMAQNPDFVIGPPPDRTRPWSAQRDSFPGPAPPPPPALLALPPYLAWLYENGMPFALRFSLLEVYRCVLALAGLFAQLSFSISLDQLMRVLLLGRHSPLLKLFGSSHGTRAELWHYPSVFGRFDSILNLGLAGFWGSWWHQSFRITYLAPISWLVRRGWLARKSAATYLVSLTISFVLSAFMHATSIYTSLPPHACWQPTACYFVLSGVGIAGQEALCSLLRSKAWPRRLRRLGNLLFTLLWMHATTWLYLDNHARSGVWLYEPVPYSPTRLLLYGTDHKATGSSRAGLGVWRWQDDDFFQWHTGEHWWDTGLAI